jgi:TRAP-type mannitol/chloroaromatic compound transport system permease small subunit
MGITCIDVVSRKLGIPIPLTKFQELEWYMHTALFSMWMGYNYTINAHPRVDSYTETLRFRTKAWIEFLGCVLFAVPYTYLLVYYGWFFFWTSYLQDEGSENAVGLEDRWIIKGVFYLGLWLLLLGIVSVLLRLIAYLVGRRPQAEVELQIGPAELEA